MSDTPLLSEITREQLDAMDQGGVFVPATKITYTAKTKPEL